MWLPILHDVILICWSKQIVVLQFGHVIDQEGSRSLSTHEPFDSRNRTPHGISERRFIALKRPLQLGHCRCLIRDAAFASLATMNDQTNR